MAVSCTEFALVSGDVGHPPYDVARQKLYFFTMEPTVQQNARDRREHEWYCNDSCRTL
jgi:hypothetical protein